jgi:DNA polymerase
MASKIDDGPVVLWDALSGEEFPGEVLDHVKRGGLVEAHNAFFEFVIWHHVLKHLPIPIQQWRCSAALAASRGLPRSLDGAAKAAGLDVLKDREGHFLMLKMCKPRKPTKNNPSEWHGSREDFERLGQYCIRDVETEYALSQKLGHLSEFEQRVWHLDLKINTRGVQCDVTACKAAVEMLEKLAEQGKQEIEDVTEGAIRTPSQTVALCKWVNEQGVAMPNLAKDTVKEYLNTDLPVKVREALLIRQRNSKASTKKYQAMIDRAADDERIRSLLLYWGAHTGRWAGAGIQVQNFPQGILSAATAESLLPAIKARDVEYLSSLGDSTELLSSCLRSMLTASPGRKLIGADYSSIEARVLLWMAGDERGLNIFRRGDDIYIDMAASIYNVLPNQVTKAQRKLGKVAILGLGYGMGAKKFVATCKSWGIDIDLDMAQRVVDAYRDKYRRVQQLWRDVNQAALNAIKRPQWDQEVGRCRISRDCPEYIYITLPSGREIIYNRPGISIEPAPWDPLQTVERIQYESPRGPTHTYGAKKVENMASAIARDILAHAMLAIDDEGHDIVLSIHDEGVFDVIPSMSVDEICKMMCQLPDWAAGLPVAAEGWEGERFRK